MKPFFSIPDDARGDLAACVLARLLVAAMLLALWFFLPGCSSGEVVVPARETAENWDSDTLRLPAPPELAPAGQGRRALPARVERYAPAPGLASFLVGEVELTRDTLTLRSPGVTRRFASPAAGETLRVRREDPPAAGSSTDTAEAPVPARVTGRVEGRPRPDTVRRQPEREGEEQRSALARLLGLPAWALGILLGLIVLACIFFFRTLR